jgi:hypothetical protein
MSRLSSLTLLLFLVIFIMTITQYSCQVDMEEERLSEADRIRYWHERNVWPPQWQDESEAYRKKQLEREKEIMQLTGSQERWENWMQVSIGEPQTIG